MKVYMIQFTINWYWEYNLKLFQLSNFNLAIADFQKAKSVDNGNQRVILYLMVLFRKLWLLTCPHTADYEIEMIKLDSCEIKYRLMKVSIRLTNY